MLSANRFQAGDQVVLLDRAGAIALDKDGRPRRGRVTRTWWSECQVELLRSGETVPVHQAQLRACPQLAYCRPTEPPTAPLPRGAA